MNSKLYVKDICRNKGITLKTLAERLGVTPSSLSQTLSSDNPGISTLEKIAAVLGVSFLDLFVVPSEALLNARFFDFRNILAKEIYEDMFDKHWDANDPGNKNLMKLAVIKANRLANAIDEADMDDKYTDDKFMFSVIEYCNKVPTAFIGVFSSYDNALKAASNHAQPFVDDCRGEYEITSINIDYCENQLENPQDIIYCDGETLMKIEPTEEYKKKFPDDAEVYRYEVRTSFIDEPLVVPDLDDYSPEESAESLIHTAKKLAKAGEHE